MQIRIITDVPEILRLRASRVDPDQTASYGAEFELGYHSLSVGRFMVDRIATVNDGSLCHLGVVLTCLI